MPNQYLETVGTIGDVVLSKPVRPMHIEFKGKSLLCQKNSVDKWKSKGLPNQYLEIVGTIGDVVLSKPVRPMHKEFKGKSLLCQKNSVAVIGRSIVNICIVYNTSPKTINSNFVFKNCLFGAIKITNSTNSDTDKWQYSGYGTGFDSKGEFAHPDGGDGKNVIIFGADLSNSIHANNKTKYVLVQLN